MMNAIGRVRDDQVKCGGVFQVAVLEGGFANMLVQLAFNYAINKDASLTVRAR